MENDESKMKFSRRQVLKGAGALLGTALLGGVGAGIASNRASAAEFDSKANNGPERDWVMIIDMRLCDGCMRCSEACVKAHHLHKDQPWIKVLKTVDDLGVERRWPKPCMQCENAPCVRVCPTHATYKAYDGVTLINPYTCIGCRMCMSACPYNARTFNWDDPLPGPNSLAKPTPEYPVPQIKGTVSKCEFCVHETRYGKLPACVDACVMEAIYMGDRVSDLASNGRKTVKLSDFLIDNDAFRLKEELNTKPRVYYIPGHGQDYVY